MTQKTFNFTLNGGLDLVSPPLTIKPGRAVGGQNYEPLSTGGYRRILGYERSDGQLSPSDAKYNVLGFDAGLTGINVGDTITGLTSGAIAEVIAVNLLSGTWATNDAAGELILVDPSSAFVDNEPLQVSSVTLATSSGVDTSMTEVVEVLHNSYIALAREARRAKIAKPPGSGPVRGVWGFNDVIYAFRDNVAGTACFMYRQTAVGWEVVTTPTLLPGGRYEFETSNFGGSIGTRAMYGCNGVNKAFEFDGTTYTEITTGMTVDAPNHLAVFKKHLFLSFGSSIQYSPIGDPTGTWQVITGAGEIATGDNVVGFNVQPGGVLAVFNRNSTYLLYGSSDIDWQLVPHNGKTGAVEWSIQDMSEAVFLDDRGLTTLSATDAYGDFQAATLTQEVEPYFLSQKFAVTSSVRVREKDQYRLFFADKSCMLMLKGRNKPQFMTLGLPVLVNCACSIENDSGAEEIYFGGDDGFVYQMEKGDSFDGELIPYTLRLPFVNLNSPRYKKRFFKVQLEIDAGTPVPLQLLPDFSYGRVDLPAVSTLGNDLTVQTGGAYWDSGANWGDFIFDGQIIGEASAYINGSGINMSLLIRGESNFEPPHTLFGGTYHYKVRGLER